MEFFDDPSNDAQLRLPLGDPMPPVRLHTRSPNTCPPSHILRPSLGSKIGLKKEASHAGAGGRPVHFRLPRDVRPPRALLRARRGVGELLQRALAAVRHLASFLAFGCQDRFRYGRERALHDLDRMSHFR